MPRTHTSDMTSPVVGHEIKKSRRAVGMTQADLAEKLGVKALCNERRARPAHLTLGSMAEVAEALGSELRIGFPLLEPEWQTLVESFDQ